MGFNELNKYSSKLGSLSNEIKEKITTVYVCHRNGFTSVVVGFNDYETFVKSCENHMFKEIENNKDSITSFLVDLESLNSDNIRVYVVLKNESYNKGYYFDQKDNKVIEKKYIPNDKGGCNVHKYNLSGELFSQDEEEFSSNNLWTGSPDVVETIKLSSHIEARSYMKKVNKDQSYIKVKRLNY
jgi:hypothetical protein